MLRVLILVNNKNIDAVAAALKAMKVSPDNEGALEGIARSSRQKCKKLKKNKKNEFGGKHARSSKKLEWRKVQDRLTSDVKRLPLFEPQMFRGFATLFSGGGEALTSDINRVAEALQSVSTEGLKLDPQILGRLDNFVGQLTAFNENVSTIKSEGVKLNVFDNFFSFILENRDSIGIGILILLLTVLFLCKCSKSVLASLLALGAAMVAAGHRENIVHLWADFKCMFGTKIQVFEPQFVDDIIHKTLLAFHMFTFKELDTSSAKGLFTKFWSNVVSAPQRADRSADTVITLLSHVQGLINFVIKAVGLDYELSLFGDKYPVVTEVLKESTDLLRKSATDRELIVDDVARRSQTIQSRISDLLVKNKDDREFAGSRQLLLAARNKLESYDQELQIRGAGRDVTRVPPKAFLFMGKPKIGKSYMLRALCSLALRYLLRNDKAAITRIRGGQTRDYVFTRNSADKFWEGYYNQLIVLLDEVGMQADVAGGDPETNEYMNLIKMVNDVVFPLLMANVEKKGTREFNSPLLMGTTNLFQFDIKSIRNRDAYDRRWIAFEAEVDPRYGKWHKGTGESDDWMVPDFAKMRESGLSEMDIALSRFLIFKERRSLFNSEQGYEGVPITIDQLMSRMTSELKDRESQIVSKSSQTKLLNDYFDSLEPQSVSEACPCQVCKQTPQQFPSVEEVYKFTMEYFGNPTLCSVRMNDYWAGWNSDIEVKTPLCFAELARARDLSGIDLCDKDIMYVYGAHAHKKLSIATDFRRSAERRENVILYAKRVLMVVGSVLGAFGIYTAVKHVISAVSGDDSADAGLDVEPQYHDKIANEILSCVTRRNVLSMGDAMVPHRGFVLAMMDNIFIAPRHYVDNWRSQIEDNPGFVVWFRRLGDIEKHQIIKVRASELISSCFAFRGDEDVVAFYVGTDVLPRYPSIRKYLCKPHELRPQGTATVPRVDYESLGLSYASSPYACSGAIKYGDDYSVQVPITYRMDTKRGDCGLPVVINDPFTAGRKVCGIHVAGTPRGNTAVAISLFRSDFDAIRDHYAERYNLVESQYRSDPATLVDVEKKGEGFNELYAVPEALRVPGKVNLAILDPPVIPTKTRIVPSPLFGKLGVPVKTKPARLRQFMNKAGEQLDPLAISASKYHRTINFMDSQILDVCKNDLTDTILNGPMVRVHDKVGRRVLTFEEAVEGIPGVEGMSGIPRKTSAGYPRCLTTKLRGKRDFFGEEGSYDFSSPQAIEIRGRVADIISSASEGKRGLHVFLEFPKDERRPKEKVECGKTRNISACPVDYAIACRQYFGAFIQFFLYNRIYNESAVGVNVYSSEWDAIASQMGRGRRVIAGDFGNYDGTLPYCVMSRFLDTVTHFYRDRGSENERIRLVLFQELVNSRHINHNGVVYEWVGSNASGNPLTTVLNSWCNLLLLRYASAIAVGCTTISSVRSFLRERRQHASFMVYGDDNIISVDRNWALGRSLTQGSLTQSFSDIGLEYTDETKGENEVSEDRELGDVSFLKRGFEENSLDPTRRYLAPLSLDTVLESIQWTKTEDFDHEYVKENVVNMLQELSMHSRKTFDTYAASICEASREHLGYEPVPANYRDCQAAILSRESKW